MTEYHSSNSALAVQVESMRTELDMAYEKFARIDEIALQTPAVTSVQIPPLQSQFNLQLDFQNPWLIGSIASSVVPPSVNLRGHSATSCEDGAFLFPRNELHHDTYTLPANQTVFPFTEVLFQLDGTSTHQVPT